MKISNSPTPYNKYLQTNSTDNISNKKTDSSQTKNSIEPFESLLSQTDKNQNKIVQQHEDEKNEKMSNKNLLDGVTYNPYTDKYTLVMDDYGVAKRKFQRIGILDNSTTITSDKPITKEYLQERYEKIQHYLKTEYSEFNKRASADNSILTNLGISMAGIKQRDTFGIVKIDGEYIEIDADEFKRHYSIYQEKQYDEYHSRYAEDNHYVSDYDSSYNSVYYKELNGIEPSFENAEKFEHYIKEKGWKGSHITEMYRKISLAVNLGLVEEGNQTLFPELYQTNKASYTFRNIENDILSQAVLDSIGSKYNSTFESVMYENVFGTEGDFFQNKLNEFAKELENNPSKYPSVNSNFTFAGDINIDENSSEEYKNFITDTLGDFMQKRKDDYMDEKGLNSKEGINHDNLGIHYGYVISFDFIIDKLKDSMLIELS